MAEALIWIEGNLMTRKGDPSVVISSLRVFNLLGIHLCLSSQPSWLGESQLYGKLKVAGEGSKEKGNAPPESLGTKK
jgi:hypothetical protein